jgi:hypothetical protein
VKWNGNAYRNAYISHEDLMKGGVLEFDMTDQPVKTAFDNYPASGNAERAVAVPLIDGGGRVFNDKTTVTLATTTPDARIYYTINGDEPSELSPLYTRPFTIETSSTIKAVSINGQRERSLVAEAKFVRKPNDWNVKIASRYSHQYNGGGDEGLIDGIRGTVNFASGEWQGYQGQDFVATIDLQKETTVRRVGGGFLQVARSWIWMPTHIEFEASTDGVNFTKIADIKTDIDATDMEPKTRDYLQSIRPAKTRYIRVHAFNLGKIPAWHPGSGGDAYIFVDEIFIS